MSATITANIITHDRTLDVSLASNYSSSLAVSCYHTSTSCCCTTTLPVTTPLHFLLLYHQTSCYCSVALLAKYCCVSCYCTTALPVTALLHYYCTTVLLVTILLHFLLLHLCTSCYCTTVLPACPVVSSSMVLSSLWRTETFESESEVFHVLTYIRHCTPAT